ncbi:MAG TPA: hypothetical protein PKD64_13950 [Pirellulaceae bacterium]|nr:hypothetical protein [Pirellulaceae bacterium]HMO93290.1 hypothetical protein [Pirellulaceae bacterium]HMP70170.1 hypothetical protein [Pirellulaceae bacterium]
MHLVAFRACIASLVCVLFQSTVLFAQTVPNVDQEVSHILNESLKFLGKQTDLESIKTLRTRGSLELLETGTKLDLELIQADGKFLLILKSAAIEIRQGFDGEIAWETSPALDRILEGEERARVIEQNAVIFPGLLWSSGEFDGRIQLSGRQMIEGKHCLSLMFEPREGTPIRRFYDPESFMLRRVQTHHTMDGARVEILIKESDWRDVVFRGADDSGRVGDGPLESSESQSVERIVKFPFMQQVAANRKLLYVLRKDSIEANVVVDHRAFSLPKAFRR